MRSAKPVGLVLAVMGGVVALIGTLVEWYSLSDVISALDALAAMAFPKACFGWLMWVLLALTVVAALFADTVNPLSTALRVASPIVDALGVVVVLVSLGQLIEGVGLGSRSALGGRSRWGERHRRRGS